MDPISYPPMQVKGGIYGIHRIPQIEVLINEDRALAMVIRGWLPKEEASKLCEELKTQIAWRQEPVMMFGKPVQQPRRVHACGDQTEPPLLHKYSGLELKVEPWHARVRDIRDRISKESCVKFDSCLLNEYATGNEYIGWHSDKEAMGAGNAVATVSLGGSRDFHFKHKVEPNRDVKTTLHNGDCVVMFGECQNLWLHSIPKRKHGEFRISLTYRCIHK